MKETDEFPDLTPLGKRDATAKLCYLWIVTVGPTRTNRELAEVLGVDETTVGQRLKKLESMGLVERFSGGWRKKKTI